VARRGIEKGTHVSVVFTDLEVEAELAIAQWFDDQLPRAPQVSSSQVLSSFS
jgi:hypothetical protein